MLHQGAVFCTLAAHDTWHTDQCHDRPPSLPDRRLQKQMASSWAFQLEDAEGSEQRRRCLYRDALQVLELLQAAGWPPARDLEARVVQYFDDGNALSRLLLLSAQGGASTWEPARHCQWPPAFQATARMLLLAAARSGEAAPDARGRATLRALPHDLLLRVLQRAAVPVSVWV